MQDILINVSVISGFLPLLAAAYNYRDLDKLMKILAAFFLLSLLFDFIEAVSKVVGVHNNMPLIHLFIALSVAFLGTVYYLAFFDNILKKITITLCALTLLVVFFYARHIWDYPSESNTISGLLFIVLSVLLFYQLLIRQEFVHIEKQGLFWFNAGVLFYYSVNIFLFMLLKKIISQNLEEYYVIHSVTNIIANLLYSAGLLCKPQTTT